MLRQASSRNQRSKGFKIKHALQISLLIAICIWLLYQVKHSHDKKRALIERSSNILRTSADKKEDFFKFGRKDIPQIVETHKDMENDETQEDEIEEDRDTKQEEIIHEIEDKEAKDDDIDEQDHDKSDEEEREHLFESTEEDEKYDNDKSKNENETKEHDDVDVFDNKDREGSTQEAREENYKRDDASSAVAHDDHATESETGALIGRIIDEKYANASKGLNNTIIDGTNTESFDKKVPKSESLTNGTVGSTKLDGTTEASTSAPSEKPDDIQENFEEKTEASTNVTSEINVGLISKLDVSVNNSSANETLQINDSYHNSTVSEKDGDKGTRSDSTKVEYENARQTNSTNEIEVGISSTTNATLLNDISNVTTQIQAISNDTGTSNEDKVSSQNMHNITDVSANNTTAGGNQILSQNIVEITANNSTIAADEQKSNNMIDANENRNATTPDVNEIRNATQGNSDNSVLDEIIEEKKDSQIDLSTLPTIQTEDAMVSDDEAAE